MRPTALLLMTMLVGTGCSLFASLDGLTGGDDAPSPSGGDGGPAQVATPSDPTTGPKDAAAPAPSNGPSDASAPDGAAKDANAGPVCKATGFRTGLDATNLGGGTSWAEPQNGIDDDGKSSEALLTASSADSAFLRISRFQLGIPAGATIRGVTVRVKRSATGSGIRDAEVRLAPNAQVAGMSRQTTPIAWSSETVVYGGADDLWGLAPTPSLLNGDAFGVAIKARFTDTAGNARARINSVEIDVAYCQ